MTLTASQGLGREITSAASRCKRRPWPAHPLGRGRGSSPSQSSSTSRTSVKPCRSRQARATRLPPRSARCRSCLRPEPELAARRASHVVAARAVREQAGLAPGDAAAPIQAVSLAARAHRRGAEALWRKAGTPALSVSDGRSSCPAHHPSRPLTRASCCASGAAEALRCKQLCLVSDGRSSCGGQHHPSFTERASACCARSGRESCARLLARSRSLEHARARA
jgi:hypothetical protein